jgi:hypothetical protein
MTRSLRIPAVLAFTVLGAAAAGSLGSCAEDPPPAPDAACRYCIYEAVDNGACPPPFCATGSNQDECPQGCIPAPVA